MPQETESTRSLRRGDKRAEYTRPGVSEEEIDEIRQAFWMMDTQDGKRDERGFIDPNDLMEAMNSLGIDWNKSELYQTLSEVDHDNSGNIGLEEFINLTTALITEQDLSRSGEPSTFDLLFKKFDQRGDDYINLDSLRLVCRRLAGGLAQFEAANPANPSLAPKRRSPRPKLRDCSCGVPRATTASARRAV